MFEGWFSLRLESNDDKTHKDVDHEEGDDDDVDEVEENTTTVVVVIVKEDSDDLDENDAAIFH